MQKAIETADIIVIGGGILGLCTAYHLAHEPGRKIVLLEKDLLAQATTGLGAGGIRQQFSHPANIRLSQRTLEQLSHFQEEFGRPLKFHRVGYLFLASESTTWADFQENIRMQRALGVPVEALNPEDIGDRWPYLNVADLQGGTFCPEDGHTDPYSVAMAFAEGARRRGVQVRERNRVREVCLSKDRVFGVRTDGGLISTRIVVNAAGPWAGEVGRMTGLNLPVLPFRRQVYITRPFPDIPKPMPLIIDQDSLFYFRGEGAGILMGKSDPDEPSGFRTHIDREFLERLIEDADHRAPILAGAEILRGWAGLYAVTPDGNPIIGLLGEIAGCYGAVGFSGHGFQHGPAVGRILSDLILEGRTDFDLRPFAFNRFQGPGHRGEQRRV
jgi:sarcosine oxidase subunit beta